MLIAFLCYSVYFIFLKCLLKLTKLTSQLLMDYDSQFKSILENHFIELAKKGIQVCHDNLWETLNELLAHSSFQSSSSKQVSI